MNKFRLIFCALALTLSACATPVTTSPQGSETEINKEARLQKELALKRIQEEDLRVQNVAFPVLIANAPLCNETQYVLGLDTWNEYSLPKEYRDTGNILYGLGEVAQVQAVYKNSPAAKNDIRVDDKIIAINGTEIPQGKKALHKIYETLDGAEDAAVTITLSRAGQEITKTVTRVQSCKYGVIYQAGDMKINAYADGKNIFITRGILRFTDNDNELALIISHELGHNVMEHMEKKTANATIASVGGFAVDILAAVAGVNTQGAFTKAAAQAGGNVYSVAFEQEADYVGMYFMERAGYKTDGVANFWRRMSAEYDSSGIKERSTHPASAERFVALEKSREEIQSKKKNGLKLEPELDEERITKSSLNAKPKRLND